DGADPFPVLLLDQRPEQLRVGRRIEWQAPQRAKLRRPQVFASRDVVVPGAEVVRRDSETVALLADAKRGLGFLLRRDVPIDADHLGRFAAGIVADERMSGDPADATIPQD